MAVIDFGRLQLRNNPEKFLGNERPNQMVTKESEDDGTNQLKSNRII